MEVKPVLRHSASRTILNLAPSLVAWGRKAGLLSVRFSPPVDPRDKYQDQQREAAREGMRRLRMRRKKEDFDFS